MKHEFCNMNFVTWTWILKSEHEFRKWISKSEFQKPCDIKHSLRLSRGWSHKYVVHILMRVRSSIIHLFYEEHTLMYTVIVLWCWYQQFYSTSMCTRVCKKHRKNTEKKRKKYGKNTENSLVWNDASTADTIFRIQFLYLSW